MAELSRLSLMVAERPKADLQEEHAGDRFWPN